MNGGAGAGPLAGLMVLDFSQFLAGPSAALRLADLGARVIKIERPAGGEAGRHLTLKQLELDGDSLLFHTINRHKESYAADLRDPQDLARVRRLIGHADVLIESFRPGAMARLGLDPDSVRDLNPRLVYGSISGYGPEGPWRDRPGQDLLVQARSGLVWLNGDAGQGPVPFGLSVADLFTGTHLAQGILACLVRRGRTGRGGLVEVSLLESVLDLQFEVLTTHLNDGGRPPERCAVGNAHAYLSAPYGIYPTADGFLALAMGSVPRLGELIGCPDLARFAEPAAWFDQRDAIRALVAARLREDGTEVWLGRLRSGGYWCADVLDWNRLEAHAGFQSLGMVQEVRRLGTAAFRTTRCPLRIDGRLLTCVQGAPRVGADNAAIEAELDRW